MKGSVKGQNMLGEIKNIEDEELEQEEAKLGELFKGLISDEDNEKQTKVTKEKK